MFRTENSVGMLKSIAMIAGLAILLWSLGLPSLRFADAANVSSFSDTISDSAPSASADHEINYTTTADGGGVLASGGFVEVTFPASFDLSTIGAEDLDLLVATVDQDITGGANWTVSTTSTTIRFTAGASVSIGQGVAVQVLIGLNATNSGSPNSQIGNSSSEGSFDITLTSGVTDAGATKIVVLTAVTITAAVDTIFTFTVAGTGAGTELTAGGDTTTGVAASTSIPFGTLSALVPTTTAQQLTVATNASNGYVVTVEVDQPLQSSTGADIDPSEDADTPTTWASPTSPTLGVDSTYGWWGITSDDTDIDSRGGSQFAAGKYIGATTSPREVMQHDGPAAANSGVGIGTTTVGFRVEISALQEAGDDYTTTLTYVATPTF